MSRHQPIPENWLEVFDYDAVTGQFSWKATGKLAGGNTSTGIDLCYKRVRRKAHRVAYYFMTGEDPGDLLVDHEDQNPHNNAWSNLRIATDEQNSRNSSGWENGSTGVKGITFEKGKFRARLRIGSGQRLTIGRFGTLKEAERELRTAREKYHGEFANHR